MQLPLWYSVAVGLVVAGACVLPFLLNAVPRPRAAGDDEPGAGLATGPSAEPVRTRVGRDTLTSGALTALAGVLALRAYLDWTALPPWAWVALVAAYAVGVGFAVYRWPHLGTHAWRKRRGTWVPRGRVSAGLSIALAALLAALFLVVVLR